MDLTKKFELLHQTIRHLSFEQDVFSDYHYLDRLKKILHTCAHSLDVSRISVWKFNSPRNAIECELLYEQNMQSSDQGVVLAKKDFPSYFSAISYNRIVNANDAATDERTFEFCDTYLKAFNIKSMLDASIIHNGDLYGVLCIEDTEKQRVWDVAEMSFAASVSDKVSSLIEREQWRNTKEALDVLYRLDCDSCEDNRDWLAQRIENDLKVNANKRHLRGLILLTIHAPESSHHASHATNFLEAHDILLKKLRRRAERERVVMCSVTDDIVGFWLPLIKDQNELEKFQHSLNDLIRQPIHTSNNAKVVLATTMVAHAYNQHSAQPSLLAHAEKKLLKQREDR